VSSCVWRDASNNCVSLRIWDHSLFASARRALSRSRMSLVSVIGFHLVVRLTARSFEAPWNSRGRRLIRQRHQWYHGTIYAQISTVQRWLRYFYIRAIRSNDAIVECQILDETIVRWISGPCDCGALAIREIIRRELSMGLTVHVSSNNSIVSCAVPRYCETDILSALVFPSPCLLVHGLDPERSRERSKVIVEMLSFGYTPWRKNSETDVGGDR
jgi:hypothetical protein